MCGQSCTNTFCMQYCWQNSWSNLSIRCSDLGHCFHLQSFPPMYTQMQMLMEVSLNSIRDILHPGSSEKQMRKGQIALENCISKWWENIQSRWTKTQSQGIHFWFWMEHCWRTVLITFASFFFFFFAKHTWKCRILYIWGKRRKERMMESMME